MKKYNPLKMWGSWVGALIVFLLSFIKVPQTIFGYIGLNQILVIPLVDSFMFVWRNNISFVIGIILTLIIGFLIGWMIHSLVRALRK